MTDTVKKEVAHPNLFLRVNGKLQRMKVGTQVTLDKEVAERASVKNKFKDVSETEEVALDSSKPKAVKRVAKQGKVVKATTHQSGGIE